MIRKIVFGDYFSGSGCLDDLAAFIGALDGTDRFEFHFYLDRSFSDWSWLRERLRVFGGNLGDIRNKASARFFGNFIGISEEMLELAASNRMLLYYECWEPVSDLSEVTKIASFGVRIPACYYITAETKEEELSLFIRRYDMESEYSGFSVVPGSFRPGLTGIELDEQELNLALRLQEAVFKSFPFNLDVDLTFASVLKRIREPNLELEQFYIAESGEVFFYEGCPSLGMGMGSLEEKCKSPSVEEKYQFRQSLESSDGKIGDDCMKLHLSEFSERFWGHAQSLVMADLT